MKNKFMIEKEVLSKLFLEENLTITDISKKYNVSTSTIARFLKKYNIKKSEEQRRNAISKTKQNKTDEEKLEYSKHLSKARKGKGKGIEPWNKGKHGVQVAWNKGLHIPGRPRTTESLEKARQTCLEKYGVEWACQRQEARLKGQNSIFNTIFEQLLKDNNILYSREFPLETYSYDFKVEDYLIEINPSATHNSTWGIRDNPPKSMKYHQDKSEVANKHGYQCIHVFDWDDVNKIKNMLQNRETIYARQCDIREISQKYAKEFINTYHLQNYAKDSVRVGLFYKDILVSIMTFDKPRYNKKYDWELIRYCSSYNVIGGSEKLISYFRKNYKGSIITYCDNSKFSGKTYEKLGFTLIRKGIPSKHWYNIKTHQHITNNLLVKYGFDGLFGTKYGKSFMNDKLMLEHGFVEIFDAGQNTYVLN